MHRRTAVSLLLLSGCLLAGCSVNSGLSTSDVKDYFNQYLNDFVLYNGQTIKLVSFHETGRHQFTSGGLKYYVVAFNGAIKCTHDGYCYWDSTGEFIASAKPFKKSGAPVDLESSTMTPVKAGGVVKIHGELEFLWVRQEKKWGLALKREEQKIYRGGS